MGYGWNLQTKTSAAADPGSCSRTVYSSSTVVSLWKAKFSCTFDHRSFQIEQYNTAMQCIARECTLYILHRGAARRHQSCAILPLRESSARCPAPFSANHAAKSSPRPPVPPPGSIVKNVGRSLGMKALGSRCSGCTAAEDLNPRPSECSHPQKTRCSADDVAGFAQTLHWLSFCNCSSTRPAATCPTAMAMTKLRFEDTTAAQRL